MAGEFFASVGSTASTWATAVGDAVSQTLQQSKPMDEILPLPADGHIVRKVHIPAGSTIELEVDVAGESMITVKVTSTASCGFEATFQPRDPRVGDVSEPTTEAGVGDMEDEGEGGAGAALRSRSATLRVGSSGSPLRSTSSKDGGDAIARTESTWLDERSVTEYRVLECHRLPERLSYASEGAGALRLALDNTFRPLFANDVTVEVWVEDGEGGEDGNGGGGAVEDMLRERAGTDGSAARAVSHPVVRTPFGPAEVVGVELRHGGVWRGRGASGGGGGGGEGSDADGMLAPVTVEDGGGGGSGVVMIRVRFPFGAIGYFNLDSITIPDPSIGASLDVLWRVDAARAGVRRLAGGARHPLPFTPPDSVVDAVAKRIGASLNQVGDRARELALPTVAFTTSTAEAIRDTVQSRVDAAATTVGAAADSVGSTIMATARRLSHSLSRPPPASSFTEAAQSWNDQGTGGGGDGDGDGDGDGEVSAYGVPSSAYSAPTAYSAYSTDPASSSSSTTTAYGSLGAYGVDTLRPEEDEEEGEEEEEVEGGGEDEEEEVEEEEGGMQLQAGLEFVDEIPDLVFVHALEESKWDVVEAARLVWATLQWRRNSSEVDARFSQVREALVKQPAYLAGTDVLGRPVVVIRFAGVVHQVEEGKTTPISVKEHVSAILFAVERAAGVAMRDYLATARTHCNAARENAESGKLWDPMPPASRELDGFKAGANGRGEIVLLADMRGLVEARTRIDLAAMVRCVHLVVQNFGRTVGLCVFWGYRPAFRAMWSTMLPVLAIPTVLQRRCVWMEGEDNPEHMLAIKRLAERSVLVRALFDQEPRFDLLQEADKDLTPVLADSDAPTTRLTAWGIQIHPPSQSSSPQTSPTSSSTSPTRVDEASITATAGETDSDVDADSSFPQHTESGLSEVSFF